MRFRLALVSVASLFLAAWTHGSIGLAVSDNFAANTYTSGNYSTSNSLGGYASDVSGNLVKFAANTPRITNQGWLIEGSSTNLIIQNQFASGWSGSGASVNANAAVSPDNTSDAMFLKEDSSTGSHGAGGTSAFVKPATAGVYVWSALLARSVVGSPRDLTLTWWNGAFGNQAIVQFNLQTGIAQYAGTPLGSYINKGCLPASNGFWLCYVSINSDAVANFNLNLALTNNSTTPWALTGGTSYTGDGASGVYIFAPQIEAGQFPSSRILTAATQVTRPADVVTITGTAAAILNAAQGTAVAVTTGGEAFGSAQTIIDSNGTALLGFNSSGFLTDGITSSLTTANGGSIIAAIDQSAIAWDWTGRTLVLNGGAAVTDAVAQTPSATLHLGGSGFNGYVKSLTVWNAKQTGPQNNFSLVAGAVNFGMDVAGAENFSPTYPLSGDWSYLAGKGIKFVRLAVAWENLQPTLGAALNSSAMTALKNAIALANSNGILVIVDVHNYAHYAGPSAWGTTVTSAGNGGNTLTGVFALGDSNLPIADFTDFNSRLATALVGTAGFGGYGLMNEPSNIGSTTTWNTAAQAAVNAIRAVDATTPIYVCGDGTLNTGGFAPSFFQPTQVTGTGIVHEAHQYWDYNPTSTTPAGGGTYSGTYTSYGTTNYQGILSLQAWLGWLKKNGLTGYLGEFNVPSSAADNNVQWVNVQGNAESLLAQQGIKSSTYFYGANNSGFGSNIQMNPVGGVTDPRIVQMLGNF